MFLPYRAFLAATQKVSISKSPSLWQYPPELGCSGSSSPSNRCLASPWLTVGWPFTAVGINRDRRIVWTATSIFFGFILGWEGLLWCSTANAARSVEDCGALSSVAASAMPFTSVCGSQQGCVWSVKSSALFEILSSRIWRRVSIA